MKVTLDLARLLSEGEISQEEYDRLLKLSARDTGSLAFNILVAFGVIAVSGGLLALFPTPYTSIALGIMTAGLGLALGHVSPTRWKVLAAVSTLVGALLLGGGIFKVAEGSSGSFILIATIFVLAGFAARSGLLVSLALLALASSVGARTAYFHASYFLGISAPGLTVVLFSVIAVVTYQFSKFVSHEFSRLALIASRTSVILVNFGFWVGSLWGDRLFEGNVIVPHTVFIIGWALALLASGIWGASRNRRWVVNTTAVFAGIHFYTQWFEHLGATPGSVVMAGLLAIGGAVGLKALNSRLRGET